MSDPPKLPTLPLRDKDRQLLFTKRSFASCLYVKMSVINSFARPRRHTCKPLAVSSNPQNATTFSPIIPAVTYTLSQTVLYLFDFSQAATTLPLSTIIVLSSCFSVSPYSTLFHVTIRASFMSNSNTLTRLW